MCRHGSIVGYLSAVIMCTAFTGMAGASAQNAAPEQRRAEGLPPASPDSAEFTAAVNRYCVTCHNATLKTAGLELDRFDARTVGEHAEVNERIIRKLRAGTMPPAGRPRPDGATYDRLVTWLESELDRAAARSPNPGRTETFHRLNRVEYQNAVRDLLGVHVDVTKLLPADDASYGFDNMAAVQRMSPTLMERYLTAARRISREAIGTAILPTTETYRFPDDLPQDDRDESLPFGTRGGTAIHYNAPADGEYAVRVRLARLVQGVSEEIPAFDRPQELEVSVDGARVHVFTLAASNLQPGTRQPADRRNLDADWQVTVPLKAGPRDIAVTFLNRTPALLESLLQPFLRPFPGSTKGGGLYSTRKGAYLSSVELSGPYNPTGAGDTPSRRRILTCRPQSRALESSCAKEILSALTRRAYRRNVTEADVAPFVAFFAKGRSTGSFDDGMQRALQALLVSNEFLFRVERDPPRSSAAETTYRISDVELASRLSFFLWSSIPDDPLLDLASAGTLHTPDVLHRQVRRMLDDPRSEAFVVNFAGQWLFLRNVPSVAPEPRKDPDFDESLRQALRRETELFFGSIVNEDRSALELLTADYTFVNERLARHYGIPGILGDRFRRVTIADDSRRGLLGQASILTVTSYPHRTSPVLRGKWILENLLGAPPPPPPPNVPDLKDKNSAGKVLTMRDRMAQHRANPVCAS